MPNTTFSAYDGGHMISPAIHTAIKLIQELNEHGISVEPRAMKITKMEPEDLKFKLDIEGIPYTELKTKNTILVSKDDFLKCWQIENQNQTKGNFLQEFNSQDLERIIENHPIVLNKKILSIKNMNPAEAGLFLRKCNKIKKGFLLESERNTEGKFNINIPEGLLTDTEKEKIVDAYIETQIEISGINTSSKTKIIIDPTIENYENAVKERRFIHNLNKMIKEKLYSAGNTFSNLGEYLKSFKMQLEYVMDNLHKGKSLSGFNLESVKDTLDTYQALPNDTYKSTNFYLKQQLISTRLAMSQAIDLISDEGKSTQREVF